MIENDLILRDFGGIDAVMAPRSLLSAPGRKYDRRGTEVPYCSQLFSSGGLLISTEEGVDLGVHDRRSRIAPDTDSLSTGSLRPVEHLPAPSRQS